MKESNLSSNPPCPGIIFPESFIEAYRFISETIVSPKNDKKTIDIVMGDLISNWSHKNIDSFCVLVQKCHFGGFGFNHHSFWGWFTDQKRSSLGRF